MPTHTISNLHWSSSYYSSEKVQTSISWRLLQLDGCTGRVTLNWLHRTLECLSEQCLNNNNNNNNNVTITSKAPQHGNRFKGAVHNRSYSTCNNMRIRSGKLNVSSEEKCLQRRLETVQGRRVANGAWQPVPCRRTCDDECTSAELCPRPLNYKVAASRRPSSTFNHQSIINHILFANMKNSVQQYC